MVITCNNLIKTTTTAVSSLIQIYLHHLLKPMGNKTEQLPCDLTTQCAYTWQVRKGELLVKNLNWSPLKSLENCFSQQNIFGVTIHCVEQEFPSKSHLLVHHTNNFFTWHASRYLLKPHSLTSTSKTQEITSLHPMCKKHSLDSLSRLKYKRENYPQKALYRGRQAAGPSHTHVRSKG